MGIWRIFLRKSKFEITFTKVDISHSKRWNEGESCEGWIKKWDGAFSALSLTSCRFCILCLILYYVLICKISSQRNHGFLSAKNPVIFAMFCPTIRGVLGITFCEQRGRKVSQRSFIAQFLGFRASIHAYWLYNIFFNIWSIEASPSTDTGGEIRHDHRRLKLVLFSWGDISAVPHYPATVIIPSIFSFKSMFLSR
jgi:hypothetical protein